MSILIAILTLISTIVIGFYGLSKDSRQDLILFLASLKSRSMYAIMQLGTLAIAIFYFILSVKFTLDDSPIKRSDLFLAPMYLFCIFAYAGLTILIYSSRKEILKNLDNSKEKGK